MQTLSKFQYIIFLLNQQTDSKMYMKSKGAQNNQTYCKKELLLDTKTS